MPETSTRDNSGSAVAVDTVVGICAAHGNRPAALIEMLHEVQDTVGYIPVEAMPAIAAALNLTRAEVHGVATFYHDFRLEPGGRHMVRVCRAEACQAVGCEALAEHAEQALKTSFGGTTADGAVTLKAVYCLGNCALGPSVMIDDDLHGRVAPERFDALIKALG